MGIRAFLDSRTPSPPAPLARWLGASALPSGDVSGALLEAGLTALDACRAAPGRVRSSAFHLLGADALLTYACEAALEAEDPRAALRSMVREAGSTR